MCTEDRALRELIAHIDDCAKALQARVEAVQDERTDGLPPSLKTGLHSIGQSCRFLMGAVAQLRGRLSS